MKRDYYEILGLTASATSTEVKSAYRKLALQFHPDRNSEHHAEEKFKEASEAYEVLSDPQKKTLYDQYGHAGLQGQGFHGFSDVGDIFSHFSDIFEDFFGFGTNRQGRGGKGRDLRLDLSISFMEAFSGAEKTVEIQRDELCRSCDGKGYPKGTEPAVCRHCGGRGQQFHSQGFFTISSTCNACRGQGKVVKEHCPDCRGKGAVSKKKKLSIKVPPGVDHGTQLFLRGEGEAGREGGIGGDLYVVVHVEEHPTFHREESDLWIEQKIHIVSAALGDEIEIETPEGKETLKIPQGTQTGELLRLRGKGMPALRGHHRGDFVVKIFVETPRKLTSRQEELLKEFHQTISPQASVESSFTKSDKKTKKGKRAWF